MRFVICLRSSLVLGLATSMLLAAGCGPNVKAPQNEVSGKVTLEGKNVVGQVVFVDKDGKEKEPAIISVMDGVYRIDLPPGDYKIAVRAVGAVASTPPPPAMPSDLQSKTPELGAAGAGASGVGPPAKYHSADDSGLTFKHPGEKQTKDLVLTP